MRPLDYEWAKPLESLSLTSQNFAVWLYMAEPFRLIVRGLVDLLSFVLRLLSFVFCLLSLVLSCLSVV